jgi:putative ABC transport system permease protein
MSASASLPARRKTLAPLDLRGSTPFGQTARLAAGSALVALGAHKLRAALTIVGIVVGVAGLFVVVNLATLVRTQNARGFGNLGANGIDITGFSVPPTAPAPSGTSGAVAVMFTGAPSLTPADVQALQKLPHIVGATPILGNQIQVQAGDHNWNTQVLGTYPDIQATAGYHVQQGSFFSMDDVTAARTVVVLGQTVAKRLFPAGNAVGQPVRVGEVDFSVVGVLQSLGANGNDNLDDITIVPVSTFSQRLRGGPGGERLQVGGPAPKGPPPNVQVIQAQGIQNPALARTNFPDVQVEVDDPTNLDAVRAAITRTLEQDHGIKPGGPDDFTVGGFLAGQKAAQQSATTLLWGMGAVALVVLLIGGFGVATVMLASVAERKREIGIRLAVGATADDVFWQFLLEALTLAAIGGGLGLLAGVGLVIELPHLLGGPEGPRVVVSGLAVVGALIVTALLGVGSGALPARRAAQTDPIVALRRS